MKTSIRRALTALIATAVLMVAAPAPGASASDIGVCPEQNTYTFNSPIGLGLSSNVLTTLSYNVNCLVKVRVLTNPVTVTLPTDGQGSGSFTYTYSGNCVFGTLGGNTAYTGFMIGTAVTITYGTPNGWLYGKVGAVLPNGICNTTSAQGTEVNVYVAL